MSTETGRRTPVGAEVGSDETAVATVELERSTHDAWDQLEAAIRPVLADLGDEVLEVLVDADPERWFGDLVSQTLAANKRMRSACPRCAACRHE